MPVLQLNPLKDKIISHENYLKEIKIREPLNSTLFFFKTGQNVKLLRYCAFQAINGQKDSHVIHKHKFF